MRKHKNRLLVFILGAAFLFAVVYTGIPLTGAGAHPMSWVILVWAVCIAAALMKYKYTMNMMNKEKERGKPYDR